MVKRVPQEDATAGYRRVFTPLAIYEESTTKAPLIFDATLEYPIARTAEVTRHPVEDGQAVTDHIVRGPKTLSFRGVFVDEETNADAARKRSDAGTHDPTNPRSTVSTMVSGGPQVRYDRAISKLDRLLGLYEFLTKPIYAVYTTNETLSDVLLSGLTHREIGQGAIEVSGTMTEIRIASPSTRRPIPKDSVKNQSNGSVDVGTKATKPVDEATAAKSIAAAGVDAIRGALGL